MGIRQSNEKFDDFFTRVYTVITISHKESLTSAIAKRNLSKVESVFLDVKNDISHINEGFVEMTEEEKLSEASPEERQEIEDAMRKISTLISNHQALLDKIDEVLKSELTSDQKLDKISDLLV